MVTQLVPLGATIPMWFCPVRQNEFEFVSGEFTATFGRPITTSGDLTNALKMPHSAGAPSTTFPVLFHCWWVPRQFNSFSPLMFPSSALGTCRTTDGWPVKTTDLIAARQPIISDYCYSSGGAGDTNVAHCLSGHSLGGLLRSVNSTFGDGHVETHQREEVQWQYYGGNGTAFY
jgi:prepilin-type processing-associated H-X9-DG protein